ncbi:transcriptional regulator, TetR family [Bryocella elongata]|uniref:Transcriptional regulator, TetR family n=1 Tax=Bryocella elongata TaxID=863522 RepID=A0A1H5UGF3_9BACT|nr:TetR/AcrR family transcriptional regulator [Bryocella elongata]SEF74145.1 transcriptional regulator, TetR family [Bryocella elongata]
MTEAAKPAPRKLRADAKRNRDAILLVAREAFTRSGMDIAEVSLDDIAKQAGIGSGTLYRHFANRDELLEAVYLAEVQRLAETADIFDQTLPPIEAVRRWMLLFIDYIATKKIIAPALNNVAGGPQRIFANTGTLIYGAIGKLVNRAIAMGEMRADVQSVDLLKALVGVSYLANTPDWHETATRLVDILLLGSRP